jgi:hypothetical protein
LSCRLTLEGVHDFADALDADPGFRLRRRRLGREGLFL